MERWELLETWLVESWHPNGNTYIQVSENSLFKKEKRVAKMPRAIEKAFTH